MFIRWISHRGFCHQCSKSSLERICGFLWLPSDLLSVRHWLMQLIYGAWASFGLSVTDPAQLTTLLPSFSSWPLPPPVAEHSPHPSAASALSQPNTTSWPPPTLPTPTPPVSLPASLRWKPSQRRLTQTESSASLCLLPRKHLKNMNRVIDCGMKKG